MIVELTNLGFVNKGAELMLNAIIQRVSDKYPDTKFVMVPKSRQSSYSQRAQLGIYQKLEWYYYRVPIHLLASLIPKEQRGSYGLILDSEVNVVLNAAGFAYGDQWGDISTVNLSKLVYRWKRQGKKIILLPQAFGPFSSQAIKKGIQVVVDNADLIYARDPVSYNNLVKIVGKRLNVRMAPDFTNLVEGIVPEYYNIEEGKYCIIPNEKMISKTTPDISNAYIPFLIICIEYLQNLGKKPFFLIHEGEGDYRLAQKVMDAMDKKIEIIREPDPIKIKGILGKCDGVIGSRYHGLVSALSQGTPTLGTGWSHKYQTLFESYQFSEGLLDSITVKNKIFKKIDLIAQEPSQRNVRERLIRSSVEQKGKTKKMWDEILTEVSEKACI